MQLLRCVFTWCGCRSSLLFGKWRGPSWHVLLCSGRANNAALLPPCKTADPVPPAPWYIDRFLAVTQALSSIPVLLLLFLYQVAEIVHVGVQTHQSESPDFTKTSQDGYTFDIWWEARCMAKDIINGHTQVSKMCSGVVRQCSVASICIRRSLRQLHAHHPGSEPCSAGMRTG